MRIVTVILLALWMPQSESMTLPTVEHHQKTYTTTTDSIMHKCPEGYEGHYVDMRPGFDVDYWMPPNSFVWTDGQQEAAFTICFKKEFMDKVRKNTEAQSVRPQPPRPV